MWQGWVTAPDSASEKYQRAREPGVWGLGGDLGHAAALNTGG